MKAKTDLMVNAIFVIVLALVVIGLLINIAFGGKGADTDCEPTTEPTAEETACAMTEPTQEETENTEPTVALYDVPLDENLQTHIIETAETYGIDPSIIMAMAYKESTYRTDVIGDGGNSYGLLQIQPKWHYKRMQKLGCTDLLDPYQNVMVGIDYLAEQIDRYDDLAKGLTAYNRGHYPGKVTNYAKTVMALAEEMRR